jgi:hypothetical protein
VVWVADRQFPRGSFVTNETTVDWVKVVDYRCFFELHPARAGPARDDDDSRGRRTHEQMIEKRKNQETEMVDHCLFRYRYD